MIGTGGLINHTPFLDVGDYILCMASLWVFVVEVVLRQCRIV